MKNVYFILQKDDDIICQVPIIGIYFVINVLKTLKNIDIYLRMV